MLNAPAALVVASVDTPVAVFRAETLALGMAPPCVSVTVPVSVAPATCARSGNEISVLRQRIHTPARSWPSFPFMNTPPVFSYLSFSYKEARLRTYERKFREEDKAQRMYGFNSRNIWFSLRTTGLQGASNRDRNNSRETRETPSLGRLQRKRLQVRLFLEKGQKLTQTLSLSH